MFEPAQRHAATSSSHPSTTADPRDSTLLFPTTAIAATTVAKIPMRTTNFPNPECTLYDSVCIVSPGRLVSA